MPDLTRDAAILTAAFSSPTAPSAPAPAASPTARPAVQPGPQEELSAKDAETVAGWIRDDLAKGKLTHEQAAKAFDQLGATPEQRLPDQRNDEQRELEAAFGPPAKAEDFLIRYGLPGQELPMTKALKNFDTSARTWLSGAEFPRDVGNSLVSAIDRVAQQTQHMTPGQLHNYGEWEYMKLKRAYGPTLDDKLRAAGRMVEELDAKQPGLKNLLKSRGIGDNAMVASLLIQQAERFWARRR